MEMSPRLMSSEVVPTDSEADMLIISLIHSRLYWKKKSLLLSPRAFAAVYTHCMHLFSCREETFVTQCHDV